LLCRKAAPQLLPLVGAADGGELSGARASSVAETLATEGAGVSRLSTAAGALKEKRPGVEALEVGALFSISVWTASVAAAAAVLLAGKKEAPQPPTTAPGAAGAVFFSVLGASSSSSSSSSSVSSSSSSSSGSGIDAASATFAAAFSCKILERPRRLRCSQTFRRGR
jgi:hypothetical protein